MERWVWIGDVAAAQFFFGVLVWFFFFCCLFVGPRRKINVRSESDSEILVWCGKEMRFALFLCLAGLWYYCSRGVLLLSSVRYCYDSAAIKARLLPRFWPPPLGPATPGDQILTGLLARAIYDKTPHFTLQFNAKVAIYLHLTAMIWPGGGSPEPRPEPVTVPER